MKKLILLLLFIPLVSLGQQYNFSELIQMTSSLRNFESSMFKKANNKISGNKKEYYNARLITESEHITYSDMYKNESEVYEAHPGYKAVKVNRVWSTFGEKYNDETKTARTFYNFYKGNTIHNIDEISTSISIQYNNNDEFELMVKYLSNNEDKFNYEETYRQNSYEKSYGYKIWETKYSYIYNGATYVITHYFSESSGNLNISKDIEKKQLN
tara:strand:- start:1970 stop:2608 length:639 start_codon:yes stop_codon:yes gene_type:complete